jgi:acetyltransferase-like isoleucine patch superfamily enzyme
MGLPNSLKRWFLKHLLKALDYEKYLIRQERVIPAVLRQGAHLFEESTIENLSAQRESIILGENTLLRGRLVVFPHGGRIALGAWCYVGARTEIWSMASITIGDRVLISHDVNIIDNSGHSRNAAERHLHFKQIATSGHPKAWSELQGVIARPIVIEDDVWINCGVIILQGVRIGARSIIAAGSIVTHDIPPDTLYRCAVTPVLTSLSGVGANV